MKTGWICGQVWSPIWIKCDCTKPQTSITTGTTNIGRGALEFRALGPILALDIPLFPFSWLSVKMRVAL